MWPNVVKWPWSADSENVVHLGMVGHTHTDRAEETGTESQPTSETVCV